MPSAFIKGNIRARRKVRVGRTMTCPCALVMATVNVAPLPKLAVPANLRIERSHTTKRKKPKARRSNHHALRLERRRYSSQARTLRSGCGRLMARVDCWEGVRVDVIMKRSLGLLEVVGGAWWSTRPITS
jgi:hypothetical protein